MITKLNIVVEKYHHPELEANNADYVAYIDSEEGIGKGTVVTAGSLPEVLKELSTSIWVLEDYLEKPLF